MGLTNGDYIMTTIRITSDEQLNEIVADIKEAVPSDSMSKFLDARLTAYDKANKRDAYLTLKDGRKYLPYPYNVRLVARLHDESAEVNDDFDI